MTYLVLLILLGILIGTLVWPRSRAPRTRSEPVSTEVPERQLAAQLITGLLAPTDYQRAMAGIAHRTSQPGTGTETGVLTAVSGDPRPQLAMLGVALPELSPSLLCSAFVMARNGADADILIRTLNLTRCQAATIIAGSDPSRRTEK